MRTTTLLSATLVMLLAGGVRAQDDGGDDGGGDDGGGDDGGDDGGSDPGTGGDRGGGDPGGSSGGSPEGATRCLDDGPGCASGGGDSGGSSVGSTGSSSSGSDSDGEGSGGGDPGGDSGGDTPGSSGYDPCAEVDLGCYGFTYQCGCGCCPLDIDWGDRPWRPAGSASTGTTSTSTSGSATSVARSSGARSGRGRPSARRISPPPPRSLTKARPVSLVDFSAPTECTICVTFTAVDRPRSILWDAVAEALREPGRPAVGGSAARSAATPAVRAAVDDAADTPRRVEEQRRMTTVAGVPLVDPGAASAPPPVQDDPRPDRHEEAQIAASGAGTETRRAGALVAAYQRELVGDLAAGNTATAGRIVGGAEDSMGHALSHASDATTVDHIDPFHAPSPWVVTKINQGIGIANAGIDAYNRAGGVVNAISSALGGAPLMARFEHFAEWQW